MYNTPVKEEEAFTHVSYKVKKKKNYKKPFCPSVPEMLKNFNSVINDIQNELEHSDFIIKFKHDLLNVLRERGLEHIVTEISSSKHLPVNNVTYIGDKYACTNNVNQKIDIVCYGLGQFSSCVIARYQLGFLLVLKVMLKAFHVYIYDPQFSVEELDFLNELGLNVLRINEEAKRKLTGKTLCFMPHCDLPLYNNLLWANWSIKHLSQLIIIGNSFQSYEINDAKCQLQNKAKYIYLANKFATEVKIMNNFRFTDIFNDLSIHYFKLSSLSAVESYLWTNLTEPEYSDDDIIKHC